MQKKRVGIKVATVAVLAAATLPAMATDPAVLPVSLTTITTEATTLVGAGIAVGLLILGWRIGKRVLKAAIGG